MKIRVTEKYNIETDDICFTVNKLNTVKKGKNAGNEYKIPIGYYSSMLNALEKIRNLVIYDEIGDKEFENVPEYIAEIKRITNNFRTEVEQLLKDHNLNLTTGDLYNGKTSL